MSIGMIGTPFLMRSFLLTAQVDMHPTSSLHFFLMYGHEACHPIELATKVNSSDSSDESMESFEQKIQQLLDVKKQVHDN